MHAKVHRNPITGAVPAASFLPDVPPRTLTTWGELAFDEYLPKPTDCRPWVERSLRVAAKHVNKNHV
jgi:hypothetical protein